MSKATVFCWQMYKIYYLICSNIKKITSYMTLAMKLLGVFCLNRAERLVNSGEALFEFRSLSYGTKKS